MKTTLCQLPRWQWCQRSVTFWITNLLSKSYAPMCTLSCCITTLSLCHQQLLNVHSAPCGESRHGSDRACVPTRWPTLSLQPSTKSALILLTQSKLLESLFFGALKGWTSLDSFTKYHLILVLNDVFFICVFFSYLDWLIRSYLRILSLLPHFAVPQMGQAVQYFSP